MAQHSLTSALPDAFLSKVFYNFLFVFVQLNVQINSMPSAKESIDNGQPLPGAD